jgi:antitoxin component of MazEF toxin-antitoxin module
VRLPAAIAREADLRDDQMVELKVGAEGVLNRPGQPRLSLADRLAAYAPMPNEPIEAMAWEPTGAEVIPGIRHGGCLLGCRIAVR